MERDKSFTSTSVLGLIYDEVGRWQHNEDIGENSYLSQLFIYLFIGLNMFLVFINMDHFDFGPSKIFTLVLVPPFFIIMFFVPIV